MRAAAGQPPHCWDLYNFECFELSTGSINTVMIGQTIPRFVELTVKFVKFNTNGHVMNRHVMSF
jgi:hypothetical protein